ncbi:hypothetical protein WN51_04926 [Melipona quadrifasciata]|uniref:Uncharacterized protein n=1 Tax=Melipona quadrifasciata TaxID=166423 RepID=A0A0M8ZUD3_9HYME|nr:hypothetical protein WN51_04926 [Melipona quadrifasciata]
MSATPIPENRNLRLLPLRLPACLPAPPCTTRPCVPRCYQDTAETYSGLSAFIIDTPDVLRHSCRPRAATIDFQDLWGRRVCFVESRRRLSQDDPVAPPEQDGRPLGRDSRRSNIAVFDNVRSNRNSETKIPLDRSAILSLVRSGGGLLREKPNGVPVQKLPSKCYIGIFDPGKIAIGYLALTPIPKW